MEICVSLRRQIYCRCQQRIFQCPFRGRQMNVRVHLFTFACTFVHQGCFFLGLKIWSVSHYSASWHSFAHESLLLDWTETNSSQAFAVVSKAAAAWSLTNRAEDLLRVYDHHTLQFPCAYAWSQCQEGVFPASHGWRCTFWGPDGWLSLDGRLMPWVSWARTSSPQLEGRYPHTSHI